MSDLEIPERAQTALDNAIVAVEQPWEASPHEYAEVALEAVAPIIVATKLRIFADRLKRVAGVEDGLRPGLLEAARIAIEEAAELDPEGATQ